MHSELVPSSQSLECCRSLTPAPGYTCLIHRLPFEIIEAILTILPLTAVSAFSQTCKAYHGLVYEPTDNHLWRTLFLNQEYDDPRLVLGQEAHISWDALLRQWTAVSKALHAHAPRYTVQVLRTLIQMAEYARPASQPLEFNSRNLQHLRALLKGSGFSNQPVHTSGQAGPDLDLDVEQAHMVSRLKLYAGLDALVATPSRRLCARSFVYDLRNYHSRNDYGPFSPDGSGRVSWKHLYAIHEVIAMNVMDFIGDDEPVLPMSTVHIQPQSIPRSEEADARDWAGLEGTWQVVFCFCDHRDLIVFNGLHTTNGTPNPSVFEDESFEEAVRLLEFELNLINVEEPSGGTPSHCPTRPILHFVGKVSGNARVKGRVYMTPDEQIRWSFVSGEPGQTIWSTEAIQVGGAASAYGALGAWTTSLHEVDDPVGPVWLWKLRD